MTATSRRSWKPWFEDRLSSIGSKIRGDSCDESPHPIRHITAIQCHEWMRQECAALNLARQQREDAVVTSITNVSSAALLAIPGLLFSKGIELPNFSGGWALYIGFASFGFALALAILEQILSSSAYRKQTLIAQAYYRLESTDQSDELAIRNVNIARKLCILAFAAALSFSAIGFSNLRSSNHGQPATTATPAAATATTAATTAATSNTDTR